MKEIDYSRYFWQNELVRLSAGQPDDWEQYFVNCFDSEGRRLLQAEIELPPCRVTLERRRAEVEAEKNGCGPDKNGRIWFAIETLDGQVVGACIMNSIDERNGTFSVGIWVHREYSGKGYGTAAMSIVMRYAFFERRLNKFHCWVLDGNVACPRMLKKLGCVEEGRQAEMVYTNGRYHDAILFGMTRKHFEEKQRQSA